MKYLIALSTFVSVFAVSFPAQAGYLDFRVGATLADNTNGVALGLDLDGSCEDFKDSIVSYIGSEVNEPGFFLNLYMTPDLTATIPAGPLSWYDIDDVCDHQNAFPINPSEFWGSNLLVECHPDPMDPQYDECTWEDYFSFKQQGQMRGEHDVKFRFLYGHDGLIDEEMSPYYIDTGFYIQGHISASGILTVSSTTGSFLPPAL